MLTKHGGNADAGLSISIDDDGVLNCPHCGNQYLHHDGVTVYDRNEDAEQTFETRVKNRIPFVSVVPSTQSRNPSSRREGLAIEFECEDCGGGLELTIAPHKGTTIIEWRLRP
jgi:hypothetical protein